MKYYRLWIMENDHNMSSLTLYVTLYCLAVKCLVQLVTYGKANDKVECIIYQYSQVH